MVTLAEELMDEARLQGVEVRDDESLPASMGAAYVKFSNMLPMILTSPRLRSAEAACYMAEELGHFNTAPERVIDYATVVGRKAELRARRWAYQRILPPEKLGAALKRRIWTQHELAEELGVTDAFLEEVFEDYKLRGFI